jgi:hypothetical protein
MALPGTDPAVLEKVKKIVAFLDADGNGFMDASEVKVLISKIAGVPADDIADDHPDVAMLSGISADELSMRLWKATDAELIDQYFVVLGLGEGEVSGSLMEQARNSFLGVYLQSKEDQMSKKLGISTKDLVAVFSEFDSDGSGSIDTSELQAFMGAMGLYGDADDIERIAGDMDADGNGSVDLKEFVDYMTADEYQNMSPSMGGSEMVKYHVMTKLYARRFAKAAQNVKQEGTGKECSNRFTFSVGDIPEEGGRGSVKFQFQGCSADECQAGGGWSLPDGAKSVFYVDFSLKDTADDADIASIKEVADEVFTKFLQPMVDSLPREAVFQGSGGSMAPAKPFHSYRLDADKALGVFRLAVYSEIDLGEKFAGTGIDFSDLIPSMSNTLEFGFQLSDFPNPNGYVPDDTRSLGEMLNFKDTYEFKWNTALLQVLGPIAAADEMSFLDGIKNRDLRMSLKAFKKASLVFARVMDSQSVSADFSFESVQECYRAVMEEFALPTLARESNYDDSKGDSPEWWMGRPFWFSEEPEGAVTRFVDTVFGVHPSTFSRIARFMLDGYQLDDKSDCAALFPTRAGPLTEGPLAALQMLGAPETASGLPGFDASTLASPFAILAALWQFCISAASGAGEPMATGAKVAEAVLKLTGTCAGIAKVDMLTSIFQWSGTFKGMDFFNLINGTGTLLQSETSRSSEAVGAAEDEQQAAIATIKDSKAIPVRFAKAILAEAYPAPLAMMYGESFEAELQGLKDDMPSKDEVQSYLGFMRGRVSDDIKSLASFGFDYMAKTERAAALTEGLKADGAPDSITQPLGAIFFAIRVLAGEDYSLDQLGGPWEM